MFTIFHCFQLIGFIVGCYYGWLLGAKLFGTIGAIIFAIIGAIIGNIIGRLPLLFLLKRDAVKLGKMSQVELRNSIKDPKCLIKNLYLLELKSRGLNIDNHIKEILDLLRSKERHMRGFGWAALTSAFPELVNEIKHYSINDSVERCIEKTQPLEKYLK